MKVAVIPARGGSKRIPQKNIKDFCGKPMIAWSIEAAIKSGCFDKILVSTDDKEIAEISEKYGAEAPFFRPKALSDDFTPTIPVIRHAANWLRDKYKKVELICCIYATAPFVSSSDLKKGWQLLNGSDLDYVFSATNYRYPIQRAFTISENNRVSSFNQKLINSRSQDLDEFWHDAGQFYWGRINAWLNCNPIFSKKSAALRLPHYRVQDIDTINDWKHAELMFNYLIRDQK